MLACEQPAIASRARNALVNSAPKTRTAGFMPFAAIAVPERSPPPPTGAITASGSQVTGFAGRITVNTALIGDPSRLVVYATSPLTASGDTARPDFLYSQLTQSSFYYSPQTGIGTSGAPFHGTLGDFTQQFIAAQGEAASAADQLKQGQEVVVNTLQQKFDATAGINIDEEMAHLLSLQNAYAANARVMSVVKEMFNALLQA